MTYAEKLRDPRWQKKRLEIMERDNWKCQSCGTDKMTLNVHHLFYKKTANPWEYDNDDLITLCEDCHEYEKDRKENEEALLICLKENKFLCQDLDYLQTYIVCNPNFKKQIESFCVEAELKEFEEWKRLTGNS
jgi:5-methylcytosine-specific restriction endonuclease McrA